MINIAGRIFVTIKIDGKDIPNAPNLVSRITMTEGMGALSPAIELVLNDYSGVLNRELALTDGNEILVTVGKSPNDIKTQSRQYRLFGTRQRPSASGPLVVAIGIYDAPGYLTGAVTESFESSSRDAIASVAKKCGLKLCSLSVPMTEDKQVWLNVCRSRANFVQDMARHGRVDNRSAMSAMLTSLGEIRYRNMSEIIETPKEKIKKMFVFNTSTAAPAGVTVYTVKAASDRSVSGLMNTWQNYGATRVAHRMSGTPDIYDSLEVSTASGFLPINAEVAKTVVKARLDYSPLDCGNNHKDYHRALYQNVRLLALFSEHVSILTLDQTNVELMDVVIYKQANADPMQPVNKSDVYVVIGKTILVKGGTTYAERIELVRRSLPIQGESKLAGANVEQCDNAASANPTPDAVVNPVTTPGKDGLATAIAVGASAAPATAKMSLVAASIPAQNAAMTAALPDLKGMADVANTGSAVSLVGSIQQSLKTLKTLKETATAFNTGLKAAIAPIKGMADQLNTLKTNIAGARLSVLSLPGGITSTFTASLSQVKQQYATAAVLKTVSAQVKSRQSELSQVPGGSQAVTDLSTHATEWEVVSNDSTLSANKLWNAQACVATGKEVPTTLQGPPAPTEVQRAAFEAQQVRGTPLPTLAAMVTSEKTVPDRTVAEQTETVTKALTRPTTDWQVEQPMFVTVPDDNVQQKLDDLGAELASSRRQEQDLGATTWRNA